MITLCGVVEPYFDRGKAPEECQMARSSFERAQAKARSLGQQVREFSFPVKDRDFRTSSWTGGIICRCVQVAVTPHGVAIRDSKDVSNKTLFFTPQEWQAFSLGMKAGEFNCD